MKRVLGYHLIEKLQYLLSAHDAAKSLAFTMAKSLVIGSVTLLLFNLRKSIP